MKEKMKRKKYINIKDIINAGKMNKNKSKILIFTLLSVVIVFSLWVVAAAQSAVNLGTAGNFVILSKSGISTTGTTSITGDIGVGDRKSVV